MAVSNKSDDANINWIVKEVTFPVPWGVIAAKAWGDPCSRPVLMIHGIQDNAGTFDRLMNYLPRTFYYVCVDLPGHGFSSRLPKGGRLDFIQYVLSVNRVVRQLKWSQFSIIGHSLGGQLGQYYAALYPEEVIKLVVLDAYGPLSVPNEDFLSYTKSTHAKIMDLEEKIFDREPPSYTYEIALQKVINSRRSFITREAAEKLITRNLKKGKNGFYFSPDQRLKLGVSMPVTHEQHAINYKKIKCPFLLVITKSFHKLLGLGDSEKVKETLVGTFKESPLFEIEVVEGHHDVHNTNPEIVAPYVSKFLLRQTCKL